MNKPQRANQDSPLQELMGLTQQVDTFSRPVAWQHRFYLHDVVRSSSAYSQWFEIIRNASENDEIIININSVGGDYYTALQLRRAMLESNAQITCSIEGQCHSAASIIFLSGDHFSVSEGSSMLIHDYSGASIGKGNEMLRQIQHEKASIDKFLLEAYRGFLTEEEIEVVISGQDMWLDDEAIAERSSGMLEYREKLFAEFLEEQERLAKEAEAEEKKATNKKGKK